MAEVVNMCSVMPGIPDRKPFWVEGSIMSFARMNLSRWLAMRQLKSFPIVEARALGWNELGSEGGPDL